MWTLLKVIQVLIDDRLRVSNFSCKFCVPTIDNFAVIYLPMKFAIFLKSRLLFNSLYCLLCFKTRIAISVKFWVFAICVEAIIYFLLYNLHDCTFSSLGRYFSHIETSQLFVNQSTCFYVIRIWSFREGQTTGIFAWLLNRKDFFGNAILISANIEYSFKVFSSIQKECY